MINPPDFDFFEDRYPKRARKPINKPDIIDDLEEEILFQKQKLMSHCVYDIQEIVSSSEFSDDAVLKVTDPSSISFSDLNIEYVKKMGLSIPMLFVAKPDLLGMAVPGAESFTVFDVLELAGKERKIEVVEVNEQKGRTMKLVDFIKYYTCPPEFRSELLNVLSLEFSLTNLANLVKAPKFVRDVDWIDNIWPKELFDRQLIHMKTNHFSDFATYPKVQRYCLLSVANCFTDFHIDFGGTSVWYHVLKGRKIFWLIEPTEENLLLYEEWIMGGNNSESFFGRIVNKCSRVELVPGMTFFIPSGWIHCVFTPEDSLVFGGNFLHSYSIPMQIRVVRSEDRIKVGGKYRFPHFKQIIWYEIENIVRQATGRIYRKPIKPKAYLADLQNRNDKSTIIEDGEETELTDDQEPCCSSAVESGCKKSGLLKDSFLSGMGIEDSDSDNEDSDGQSSKIIDVNNDNICYDDMPNGADGCYMLVPTQMKFSRQNHEMFTPVNHFCDEFINSISSIEINGYYSMLEYAKKLLKTKRPDVGEGITRPKHLLLEFENLVKYLSKAGRFDITNDFKLFGAARCEQNHKESTELIIKLRTVDSASAFFQTSKKSRQPKRKLLVPTKSEEPKRMVKVGKQAKRLGDPSSILVDGLPHPLHSSVSNAEVPPNPYDFNPLEIVVPLGQKPLQSAYRQSSNMAQAPPSQRFKLKKKELSHDEPTATNNVREDSTEKLSPITTSNVSSSLPSQISPAIPDLKQRTKPLLVPVEAQNAKFVFYRQSVHSDDPELAYKSPLQRLQHQSKPNVASESTSTASSSNRRFRGGLNYTSSSGGNNSNNTHNDHLEKSFNRDVSQHIIQPSSSFHHNNNGYDSGKGFHDNSNRNMHHSNDYNNRNKYRNSKKYGDHNRFNNGRKNNGSRRYEHQQNDRPNHEHHRHQRNSRDYSNEGNRQGYDMFNNSYNSSFHNGSDQFHHHQYQQQQQQWHQSPDGGFNSMTPFPPWRFPPMSSDSASKFPSSHPMLFWPPGYVPPTLSSFPNNSNNPLLYPQNDTSESGNSNAPKCVPSATSSNQNEPNDDDIKAPPFERMDIDSPKPETSMIANNNDEELSAYSTNNVGKQQQQISWKNNSTILVNKGIQQPQQQSLSVVKNVSPSSYNETKGIILPENAGSPQQATMLDGFEAINEIGRLTKIMAGDNEDDIDLRDPNYLMQNNLRNSSTIDVAKSRSPSPKTSKDPSIAIDEIYRISKMFQ